MLFLQTRPNQAIGILRQKDHSFNICCWSLLARSEGYVYKCIFNDVDFSRRSTVSISRGSAHFPLNKAARIAIYSDPDKHSRASLRAKCSDSGCCWEFSFPAPMPVPKAASVPASYFRRAITALSTGVTSAQRAPAIIWPCSEIGEKKAHPRYTLVWSWAFQLGSPLYVAWSSLLL